MAAMIFSRMKKKFNALRFDPGIDQAILNNPPQLMRLGTRYGGWMFDRSRFGEESWALLCGAGEDISFDLEFQRETTAKIVIVDPTPRAIAHWSYVLSAAENEEVACDRVAGATYDLSGVNFGNCFFIPVAVWSESSTLRFWEPENPNHVSYSATNLQKTSNFIEVDALTPIDIAKNFGLDLTKLGLLKLDVEGAEGRVIDWFIDNDVLVPQILVEYDELNIPSRMSQSAIRSTHDKLISSGYDLVAKDGPSNYVYILNALTEGTRIVNGGTG